MKVSSASRRNKIRLSAGARLTNLTSQGLLKILRRTDSAIRDDGRWYVDPFIIDQIATAQRVLGVRAHQTLKTERKNGDTANQFRSTGEQSARQFAARNSRIGDPGMKTAKSPGAGEATHKASEIDERWRVASKSNPVPELTQARVGASQRGDGAANLDGDAEIVTDAELVTKKPLADVLRIIIEPTKSGRKWIVRLDNRIVCVSAWPFVKSARRLLAEGHPAEAVFEMWRPGDDAFSLRGKLGAVAATVMDGERAMQCAKNGLPVRQIGGADSATPPGAINSRGER